MQASEPSGYSGGAASFRILIVGESGAGKTRLTHKILLAISSIAARGGITVIDMAPDYMGVGRPIQPVPGARIIRARLHAPRLMSRGDCSVAWRLARENARITTSMILEYLESPTPVLAVNDLSIHLHSGDPKLLHDAVRISTIFVGNSYMGERLRDECGLWEREAQGLEDLERMVDLVWHL
ncbi:MAG: hypothetical protein F7B18_07595 [Desulfurococcales archaeon]|nr:hypothetical protein [Desulfurococcales archaeon]